MKYLVALIMVVGLFSASAAMALNLGEMRVSLLEGDVQSRNEDTEDWIPSAMNMPVAEGDSIWVPEGGKVEIQTQGNSYIRLNENTGLDVVRVDEGAIQVYTSQGQVFVNNQGRKGDVIQVDTPAGTARVFDKAIFRLDVREAGNTEIWVYRGTVRAEGKGGRKRVPAGKILSIDEDGSADLYNLEDTDSWERWNLARDRALGEHLYSSNYLPDELDVYASDFDNNGRWVNVPDYGYVWTPTVMVSSGWAPYQTGRWVWMRGDYVWVSYEPWGWAPYHYGRWAFVASVGWCWVPPARGSVYWGPGYVGWVHTPTAVAWVPLAPGDIYYGYGNYGPHSVNILNVRIDTNVVRRYRNLNVRNAVFSVDTERFYRGDVRRGGAPALRENPFLSSGVSVGRPQLRRERSVFMPVIKDVPRAKLPPQRLRTAPETRLKELRETRPMVRQRSGGSVFTPGASRSTVAPPASRTVPSAGAGALRERRQDTGSKIFTPQPYRPQTDSGREKRSLTPRTRTRSAPTGDAPATGDILKGKRETAPRDNAPAKTERLKRSRTLAPKADDAPVKGEVFKERKEEAPREKSVPAMKGRESGFKGGGKDDDKPAETKGGDGGKRSFR